MAKKKIPTKSRTKKPQNTPAYQVAALPLRKTKSGELQVLILTSRETRRWIIPKGWPKKGIEDCIAASEEAREEAGLIGVVQKWPMGSYRAFKRLATSFKSVTVRVFRFDVLEQLDVWREKGQRATRWASLEQAAALVDEPGLLTLLERLHKNSKKHKPAVPAQ